MGDTIRITGIDEQIKGKTEIRSGTGELFIRKGDKLYLIGESFNGLKITYNQQPLDCYGIKLQEVNNNGLDRSGQ